ncbi:MAG: peptidase, partial [Planctomycetota bacterium]
SRIDQIKADLARLADPRGLSDQQANVLLARTPAVAWLAYSIHGDELSGADAALAAGWHYASCTDPKVQALLDEVIIIIDPVMNPDGRDRYLAQLREMRSSVPTTDDQSRLHGGRWPYGRTNHYLFDMNRDWIFGICPETRGRIQAASAWHPMLFVDAHEMGPQDTYLFSPSREPINGNYPKFLHKWLDIFAGDQSAAFDRRGWRYYTGEWADDWYPGYSNAWASFRGAIGILYEQAGVDWYGVKRPEGRILTYRESVHHQLLSTLVNVETLHAHRDEIKQGWFETRRACVAPDGPYANRTFAIVPNANVTRLEAFANMMRLQGFEMFELTEPFSVPATDRLGRRYDALSLPAGTVLVPNAQPNAHLLAAMLEFDPRMSDAFLEKERRELIRRGDTELYDITGWSLPMLLDLDAYELHTPLPEAVTRPFTGPVRPRGGVDHRNPGQGWVIDGTDDQTPAVAMRLMRAGVRVRFADEPFTWGTRSYARGSLVVAREDQQRDDDSWIDALDRITRDAGLLAEPIETGLGAGVIADIGGEHFDLLTTPRIAVLTESPVNSYDFGSIWHTLDERFKLPASYIPAERLSWTDLRRYNVLIAPEGAGDLLEEAGPSLARWIESGGTLIAIGSSARAIARDEGLSSVRLLRDVLDELDDYEIAVLREFASHADSLDAEQLWSYRVGNSSPAFPWDGVDFDRESVEQLERRDAWQRQFMPPGTIVAARVDDEHWLTAGCGDELPILFGSSAVLMAMDSVEVPLRFGVLEDDAESTEPRRIGWCTIPAGRDLRLRMSGLLWPEAAHRIANGAAVTREPVGSGQIILFADPPTFRAASLGTMRVFMNAVIYGPGLGASQPIMP